MSKTGDDRSSLSARCQKNDPPDVALSLLRRSESFRPKAMHKPHKTYAKWSIEAAIFRN
jgi:hypothetical protein